MLGCTPHREGLPLGRARKIQDPYSLLGKPDGVSRAVQVASSNSRRFSALFVAVHCPDPTALVQGEGEFAEVSHQGKAVVVRLKSRDGLPAGKFGILESGSPNISLLFTFEKLDFVKRRLERLLRKPAGAFSTFHMDTSEMRDVLTEFASEKRLSLEALKAITYPFGRGARVDYARRPQQEVFATAFEEEKYVESLRFEAHAPDEKALLNATIFRDCSCKFFGGDFGIFWDGIIPRICYVAGKRAQMFLNRNRRSYQDEVKPLGISFGRNVFVESSRVSELLKALTNEGKFTVAVLHANPYLRATLTDFADGSTMDLYITSPREASIIPGFGASIPALSRLARVLSERIGEGIISPEHGKPITFEELGAN